MTNWHSRTRVLFLVGGFLGGLTAPAIAWLLLNLEAGRVLLFPDLIGQMRNEPLMWVIATTPIFMGLAGWVIGIQTKRYQAASRQLAAHFEEQAKSLQSEYHFFQALITNSPFAVVQLDADHHIVNCNPAFEDLFGYSQQELINRSVDKIVASDELYEEAKTISKEVTGGKIVRQVSRRRCKDGTLLDVEIFGVPVVVGGEKIGALGMYHDISRRLAAERAIQESEARFRSLFDNSPIALWEEDFSRVRSLLDQVAQERDLIEALQTDDALIMKCIEMVQVLNVNQATLDLYLADSKSDLLTGLGEILSEESLDSFRDEMLTLAQGGTFYETEIAQRKLNGETIHGLLRLSIAPGCESTWEKVFISILDITDRKRAEDRLRFLSFHDALSGLYNRAYFEEEIERLERSRQYPVSVINCDLDGMKLINDTHGHAAGDAAIQGAAAILKHVFRAEDVVARIGGDEFAVILPNTDIENTPNIIRRLETAISAYNADADDGLFRPLSLSYGCVTVPVGESLVEAYKLADERMYAAKASKK